MMEVVLWFRWNYTRGPGFHPLCLRLLYLVYVYSSSHLCEYKYNYNYNYNHNHNSELTHHPTLPRLSCHITSPHLTSPHLPSPHIMNLHTILYYTPTPTYFTHGRLGSPSAWGRKRIGKEKKRKEKNRKAGRGSYKVCMDLKTVELSSSQCIYICTSRHTDGEAHRQRGT